MPSSVLTARRVGADRFLTGLSVGIAPDQDLIGDRLLPVVKTDLASVLLAVYGNEAWTMIDDLVGDHSKPKRLEVTLGSTRVSIDGHALIGTVSDREQIEATKGPAQFDLESDTVYTVKQNMLLRREKLQADLIQNSGTYPGPNVIDLNAIKWDTIAAGVSTNDPIDQLLNIIEYSATRAIGRRPNKFWTSGQVWAQIVQNTKVKNRIFGTIQRQGVVAPDMFASLIGVDEVLVGRAVSRSGATTTDLWGKSAGLLYVPPVAGARIPAFGYTAEQRVFGDSSEAVIRIRDEEMGASGGNLLKRSAFYSPVVTFNAAGTLFINVIA